MINHTITLIKFQLKDTKKWILYWEVNFYDLGKRFRFSDMMNAKEFAESYKEKL